MMKTTKTNKTSRIVFLLFLTWCVSACNKADTPPTKITQSSNTVSVNEYQYNAKEFIDNYKFGLSGNNTTISVPLTDIENLVETYLSDGDAWQWKYEYEDTTDNTRQWYNILTYKDGKYYLDMVSHYDSYNEESYYVADATTKLTLDDIVATDPVLHLYDLNNDEFKGVRRVQSQEYDNHYEITITDMYGDVSDLDDEDKKDHNYINADNSGYIFKISKNGVLQEIEIKSPVYTVPLHFKYLTDAPAITVQDAQRETLTYDAMLECVQNSFIH